MIAIEINGAYIELAENSNIRYEQSFATVIEEVYQGDFSFPFDLPASDVVLKALGYLTFIEASSQTIKYDCLVYVSGLPFKKAKLLVLSATNKTIKVNLSAGLNSLNTADLSLKNINYGDDIYMGEYTDSIVAKATAMSQQGNWQVYGCTFVPHSNPKFYGDSNNSFNGVLNAVDPNNGNIHGNSITYSNKYAIVPFFFLFYVLKKIFDQEGYKIAGDFWNNAEAAKILLYNNCALDSNVSIGDTLVRPMQEESYILHYTTGSIYSNAVNVKFYKGLAETYDNAFAYDNNNLTYKITAAGQYAIEFNYTGKMPALGAFYVFLDGVYLHRWVNFNANYSATEILLKHVFSATLSDIGKKIELRAVFLGGNLSNTPIVIDKKSYIKIYQPNDGNINYYKKTIKPSQHMKDITVAEFLLALKKSFGIDFNFNESEKIVNLNFIQKQIESSSIEDWTSKATNEFEIKFDNYNKGYLVGYDFGDDDKLTVNNFNPPSSASVLEINTINDLPELDLPGAYIYIKNLNVLYYRDYNSVSSLYSWVKSSDYYFKQKFANAENEILLTMAPMLMTTAKNIDPSSSSTLETALMPASENPGSSEMYGVGENDFPLRIMFYRGQNIVGYAPNNKGGNYILANTTCYGLNGNMVGNYDLTLHLKSSFYQQYLKPVFELSANGQEVEKDLRFNELDVLTIENKRIVIIDGVRFILKNISFTLSKVISVARAKLLKI